MPRAEYPSLRLSRSVDTEGSAVSRLSPARKRLMSAKQQARLFGNTARAMGDAPREIKIRHIGNCLKADPAYGKGVAEALGIPLSEVPT
jgi:catalase